MTERKLYLMLMSCFRFPYEIVRMEFDEKELRREIAFAIRNIHGQLIPIVSALVKSFDVGLLWLDLSLQFCNLRLQFP